MFSLSRRRVSLACALLALSAAGPFTLAHAQVAQTQAFPAKPVTLVIPFPPGGATDIVGRLVGRKLAERLGQPVVIDNRAGAGTIVGATSVANAAPDGYTLLISSGSTFTANPALHSKLSYDPVKSFDMLGGVARVPLVLLAHKDFASATLPQLSTAAKATPGKIFYASFGSGTTSHFAGELLWNALGVQLVHVPYKGSAPAMADLMAGQVPLSVDTVAAALPQIKAGKIKAVAVMGAKRAPQLPDVPTAAERGAAGFAADSWLALAAPRGVPGAVKTRLQTALAETMADAEVKQKLLDNGLEAMYESAAASAARIDDELPRMRAIAQRASIRAE